MNIQIEIYQTVDCRGKVTNVCAKARIEASPSEGFDFRKLGALERDLGPYVAERLLDAIECEGGDLCHED